MAVHYLEKSDSTLTECGRNAHKIMSAVIGGNADGVDCYYCLNKLSKRGIRFSPPTPVMHAKDCTCIICIAISARDKEWVAWAESQCPHTDDLKKRRCAHCMADRLTEIGL
jgi:hypothetical protein